MYLTAKIELFNKRKQTKMIIFCNVLLLMETTAVYLSGLLEVGLSNKNKNKKSQPRK